VTVQNPHPSPDPESKAVTLDEVPTQNPVEGWGVDFQVPDIAVKMVHADVLEEYEVWFAIASFLGAAFVGFLVAYIQSFNDREAEIKNAAIVYSYHSDATFLVVALLFLVLFAGISARAYFVRRRIRKKSTSYKMRVTSEP
jgi:hypothetical protein